MLSLTNSFISIQQSLVSQLVPQPFFFILKCKVFNKALSRAFTFHILTAYWFQTDLILFLSEHLGQEIHS